VIRLAILSSALGVLDLFSVCGSCLYCAGDMEVFLRAIDDSDLFPGDSVSTNSSADLLESIVVDSCRMSTFSDCRIW
jgi:hypothetical protein